jgi:hypothetical protein
MKIISPKLIDAYGDNRGIIYVIDDIKKTIPFEVKRFYFISNTSLFSKRAGHGHKELKQFFVLVNGYVEILLSKPGSKINSNVIFNTPGQYFYLEPGFYRDIIFKDNSVLLVFASDTYNEQDYF